MGVPVPTGPARVDAHVAPAVIAHKLDRPGFDIGMRIARVRKVVERHHQLRAPPIHEGGRMLTTLVKPSVRRPAGEDLGVPAWDLVVVRFGHLALPLVNDKHLIAARLVELGLKDEAPRDIQAVGVELIRNGGVRMGKHPGF